MKVFFTFNRSHIFFLQRIDRLLCFNACHEKKLSFMQHDRIEANRSILIHSLYFLFHFSSQRSHHPCLCIWKRIFERYSVTIDIFLKINTVAFLMFIDRKRWFKKNKNKLLLQMDFSLNAHLLKNSLNLESDLSCSCLCAIIQTLYRK